MANLKLSLGLVPSTSKVEQAEIDLIKEFEKLQAFVDSEELAKYNELDALVNTADFRNKKKEIESLHFKNSEEHNRENEFKKLEKSKELTMYFRTRDGASLKSYREMDGSETVARHEKLKEIIASHEFKQKQKMKPITFKTTEEYNKFREYKKLAKSSDVKNYRKLVKSGKKDEAEAMAGSATAGRYKELEAYVNSSEFLEKKNMKPITFKDSEEYKLLQEFNTLNARQDIKSFYKFRNSKELSNYNQMEGSQKLGRFEELKEYVSKGEFKERKEYLLDKKRFEKTDMFKQLKEYETLKKSDDIVWFFKVKDSNKFDILKNRVLTFSDEFEGEKLDTRRWLTNHFWGDRLLNDRYSLEKDLHCYTESDNFEVRNSVLRIITKPQKAEGKVWNPMLGGFRNKEFGYTSGTINTGKSFRQQYGIFKAKVKLNTSAGPRHAFYMLADKITPHLDICRTGKGKVWMDLFTNGSRGAKTSIGSKFSKDYYIYTLEWTSDKLVWKINDMEVFTQTGNLPQEPMYLNFTGGLEKSISGSSSLEIDWVRVYQWK